MAATTEATEANVAASLTFLLRLPIEPDIRLDKLRGCRLEATEATEAAEAAEATVAEL